MNAAAFRRDVGRAPAALRAYADLLADDDPWRGAPSSPRRVVLLGMGSSRFASLVAASRLRARGIDAVAEYASARDRHPGGAGTLAVGVSASGSTPETVEALARHRAAGGAAAAVTNDPASALAVDADVVVDLAAGREEGGVACRTFRHTVAALLALEARLVDAPRDGVPDAVRRAADATDDLLARRDGWLADAVELLAATGRSFAIAPAERISSAEQGALMLREGPRLAADACETGDWLHVDVYLTKPLDYRALLFVGSRFDAEVMRWVGERGATVVAVAGDVAGARASIRFPGDDREEVALLTEVVVPELVAAEVWEARP